MKPRLAVGRLIGAYSRWISPLLPASCRFYPSCSHYARDAVEIHGVWRGGWLTLRRLGKCQPWCRGGYDPVPGGRPSPRTG